MAANILVATPQTAFGELLRLSLEESGRYRVRLVQSGLEAEAAASRIPFDLAFLDAATSDIPLIPLIQTLCSSNNAMRLVIIPPDNDPSKLTLNGVHPDGYLNLPFYAPDLLDMVSSLLGAIEQWQAETHSIDTPPAPELILEPDGAAQILSELLLQTSALAGFLLRSHKLWISQGSFGQEDIHDMAAGLNRAWEDDESGDLARFTRLKEGGQEFMLYATQVVPDILLALVYEPGVALSVIRGQARKTARSLHALAVQPSPPPVVGQAETTPTADFEPLENTVSAPPESQMEAVSGLNVSKEELDDLLSTSVPSDQETTELLSALERAREDAPGSEGSTPAAPVDSIPETIPSPVALPEFEENLAMESTEGELPEVSLTDLLAAMPPPDPEEQSQLSGGEWVAESETEPAKSSFLFPWEMELPPAQEVQASQPERPSIPEPMAAPDSSTLEDTQPISRATLFGSKPQPSDLASSESIATGTLDPVQPFSQPEIKTGEQSTLTIAAVPEETEAPEPAPALEPVSEPIPALPDLPAGWEPDDEFEPALLELATQAYTCMLMPHEPDQPLTGRLASKLDEWLPQICAAYGWKLESEKIRPDYLEWTVKVSPVITPSSVVRLVRLQTSQRIFNDFARFAAQAPSGDFWAPGYLITSGSESPDPDVIRTFIDQTRKRQGITK